MRFAMSHGIQRGQGLPVGGAVMRALYRASIMESRRQPGERLDEVNPADPRIVGIPHGVPASRSRVLDSVSAGPLWCSYPTKGPEARLRCMRHLPTVDELDRIPTAELPAVLLQLSALTARAAVRLQDAARDQGDDCEAYEAEEAARRLKVSVDTLREHGEAWGVARVLTQDKNGKATRVVYPRALLRAFLATNPTAAKRSAA